MRTLPRHLVLAAVVLTVCCAQRQAAASTVDLGKARDVAGHRLDDSRLVQQHLRQRRARHCLIRPAARLARQDSRSQFGVRVLLVAPAPATPVIHAIYPPSRFRLPPPAILA